MTKAKKNDSKAIAPEVLPKADASLLDDTADVSDDELASMMSLDRLGPLSEDADIPDAASLERIIQSDSIPSDLSEEALSAPHKNFEKNPVIERGDTFGREDSDDSDWKRSWNMEILEAEAFKEDGRDIDLGAEAYKKHSEEKQDFRENKAMEREISRALVPAGRQEDSELGNGPGNLLRRYLKEISQYPLLTKEEEYRLAVRYKETGDQKAAWRLTTANLRLVVKIANEYRRQTMKLLDLIQEGNVGLVKAVQKFDPYRGVKLSSYASFWIRAYLLRYIMENFRMVKIGTSQTQRKIFFNLNKERKKLMDAGFDPTPKLLADKMGVSEMEVAEMEMRMAADEQSMDAPSELDGGRSFGERFSTDERGVDEKLGDQQVLALFKSKLKDFEATLEDEREKVIFHERLTAEESPRSLQSIADQFGLTKERIRQVSNQLMEKMRSWFMKEIPEFKMLSVIPQEDDAEEEDRKTDSPGRESRTSSPKNVRAANETASNGTNISRKNSGTRSAAVQKSPKKKRAEKGGASD